VKDSEDGCVAKGGIEHNVEYKEAPIVDC